MIVSVTRDDLRDEFIMANDAFALSPISARATQPSEEDYDAISEAFMETARGRWFLGEYAKRNRNADTSMVLDAVARIEQSLAAQKQPPPESGLAEALAAIRTALDQARDTASAALDSLALEEHLALVRKGARVIKEISWRWREIGADGRICDLLDSQVGAIEASCGQLSSADARTALSAAFDLVEGRIAEFDDGETAPRQAAEEAQIVEEDQVAEAVMATPSSSPSADMPAAAVEPVATATNDVETEAATTIQAAPAKAVVATADVAEVATEASDVVAGAADDRTTAAAEATTEAAEVSPEITEMTAEAADAHDDAVLEMIALEMAAPDPADTDTKAGVDSDTNSVEMRIAEPPPAEPETIAAMPEAVAIAPAIQPSLPPSPEPSPKPSPETSRELEPSLGSSLVASGIVRKPKPMMSDPLAPIRRMSQAEKIALFS
jgi:hypothetical protein